MRSKSKRMVDGLSVLMPMILLSILVVLFFFFFVNRPIPEEANIWEIVLLFVLIIITAVAPTVSVLTRRDTDREVVINLSAELNGILKKLCHNENCACGADAPIQHGFFDSLIASGMMSHVNPDYLYDIQHVYWTIKDYNKKCLKYNPNGTRLKKQSQDRERLKCQIIEMLNKLEKDNRWWA